MIEIKRNLEKKNITFIINFYEKNISQTIITSDDGTNLSSHAAAPAIRVDDRGPRPCLRDAIRKC